ncbi:hypothetical protein DZJ_26080 [Dickeya ananatis]
MSAARCGPLPWDWGGEHYDLGADGAIAFQPLARIDQAGWRRWAAEWVVGRIRQEGVNVGPEEKAAIWSALDSLAGAPVEQRTLTGLSVLLQSLALRQALAPYVLGGAYGNLLDADQERLGDADVQCFEMEALMPSKAAVLAVLEYLFVRLETRFDGAPTLLILDESWLFLDEPVFAARIRQWLKTLRKKKRQCDIRHPIAGGYPTLCLGTGHHRKLPQPDFPAQSTGQRTPDPGHL